MTKKLSAEAKMARSIRMLKVAMGPRSRVIGAATMPSRGIVVLSMRLTPIGAFSQSLAKGLCPCRRTQGVCARNQTSSAKSLPPEGCTLCVTPCAQTDPFAKTDSPR